MKTIDQIISANSLSSIEALRGACEFVNSRTETDNQSKTFNQLMIDFLTVKFPDFFVKQPKAAKAGTGGRGTNFKQPTLVWLAVGENAKLPIADSLIAWRTENPELITCPDQTFKDYYNRYNKNGMRATEPGEKAPKVSTKRDPTKPIIAVIPEDVEEVVVVEAPVEVKKPKELAKPVKVLVNEETRKVKPAAKATTPAKKLVKK